MRQATRSSHQCIRAGAAAATALLLCWAPAAIGAEAAAEDTPPEGVEILLPRGAIAAVFEPRFVSASEAELPDEAVVLGVAIGEEARAYSLNLLNSHEVVNDEMAGTAFAAVW